MKRLRDRLQGCWQSLSVAILVAAGLAACEQQSTVPQWSGYAEGEFLYLSSALGGPVTRLAVQEGQQVLTGDALFSLDDQSERAALAQSQAQLAAAKAQWQNTEKGRRPAELAVTRAQLAQARAQTVQAQSALERQQALVKQGFASAATLDAAKAAAQQAAARVVELQAAVTVAGLPARVDEQSAASAQLDAAAQAVEQAQWRLSQKSVSSPVKGRVASVIYRAGEFAGAGQPVVSVLPEGAVKALFFVPEAQLADVPVGARVIVSCDGCGEPVVARVSHVADAPEFTPPVIYSNAQRSKLVYRVEARGESNAEKLHWRPGQPIDVTPADWTPVQDKS
ncbi:HlyD family efflux transporter periplasmic adaptor subunit [Hydrogenophaga sp. 5NK40-0174]|uniref:HlyD family secretion protein n=1 Tax=Hydrogenophaga sp. 5NK40-0174 TaxID=3127649 RepID=UPI00310A989A